MIDIFDSILKMDTKTAALQNIRNKETVKMTKLYCPKGHGILTQFDDYKMSKNWRFNVYSCSICIRPYFDMDCLTEPLANDTNVVDIPKTESQIAVDRVIHALRTVWNYEDIDIATNVNVLHALIKELEELSK